MNNVATHKVISIIQPSFLPWRGYFQIISQSDGFVFYDDVQYDKHGWRNRNQIKTASGPQWITVPVLSKGKSEQPIFAAQIDNTSQWGKKIIKSVAVSYKKAAYFDLYFEWFSKILNQKWESISALNIQLTKEISYFLEIKTAFYLSSELKIPHGDPTQRLVEICKSFSANTYVSGPSAKAYIGNGEKFTKAGVHLEYASYQMPPYTQLFGPFFPTASIIDLLFNEGPNSKEFLKNT